MSLELVQDQKKKKILMTLRCLADKGMSKSCQHMIQYITITTNVVVIDPEK